MDLFAYNNIVNLDEVAKANNIVVPRLRGYRLMSEEKALTAEELENEVKIVVNEVYDSAVCSEPRFSLHPCGWEYSSWTDYLKDYYLDREKGEYGKHTIGFKWDRVHGKARRNLKLMVKQKKKAVLKQYETYNKYCGREDVLYVHARIGGGNWSYYGGNELTKQPWFIEKVDDSWDKTYCDIYAKIDPNLVIKGETGE